MPPRKKQTKKTSANGGTPAAIAGLFSFVIKALPLGLIVAGVAWGSSYLWQKGVDDREFSILPSVTVVSPGEFRPEALKEFRRLGNVACKRNLLEPSLLCEIREHYQNSPWVKKVCRLERVFPNRINVEFIPRQPFIQVYQNGYYWIIDNENTLLPVNGSRRQYKGLPTVKGDINKRPGNGIKWNDPGIAEAVRAVLALDSSPLAQTLPIKEVLVKKPGFLDRFKRPAKSRARLELRSPGGINILWGSCGAKCPGDLSTDEKIVMLRKLVDEWQGSSRCVTLDVRTRVAGYNIAGAQVR